MRRKLFIAGVIGILLVAFAALLAPGAPPGWSRVHPGITRTEVLLLAGAPQQSGWPEKVAETWQRNGLVCHRRLFIIYQGENVHSICDGVWIRGYGWAHTRKESL